MRVLIYGSHKEDISDLAREIGLEIVRENPEVILSYGGDGTFLGAEREYPGIPKVAIRPTRAAKKCERHLDRTILERLAEGKLSRVELTKVEASFQGRSLIGMNEVALNRVNSVSAVRYRVRINGTPYSGEIIGDGLVVATPFGSTGYYRSITHSYFEVGIGLAFNNCTERIHHLVLDDRAVVELEITRGPAHLAADNDPDQPILDTGDNVVIRKHPNRAVILGIDSILCKECRGMLRGPFQISERLPFWTRNSE